MSDHIPDLTKMSDTPISDSTPHNVAELGMLCRKLERQLNAANEMFRKLNIHALNLTDRIRRLEEDLMDAKNKHAALVADVVLYEDRGERIKRLEAVTNDPHALWANWLRGSVTLPIGIGDVRQYQERIKRLEEAGDVLCAAAAFMGWHMEIEKWNKAKEAKP